MVLNLYQYGFWIDNLINQDHRGASFLPTRHNKGQWGIVINSKAFKNTFLQGAYTLLFAVC